MYLVICHVGDVSAVQAYRALLARSPGRVDCVTVETLCAGLAWEHRLTSTSTMLRVRLADGREIYGDQVEGVLNRVHTVAPVGVDHADAGDGEYATQELNAFFLSWLAGLDAAVVNEPTPQGLAGRQRTALEWTWLARESGLPIVPRLWTAPAVPDAGVERRGHESFWTSVVGGRVVGPPLHDDVAAACAELARRAGAGILGVLLDPTPDGVAFAGATPTPHLPVGDDAFLDALCGVLGMTE